MIFPKPVLPHLSRSRFSRKSLVALSGLLLALAVPTTLVYGKQLGDFPTTLSSVLVSQSAPAYKFTAGQRLIYKLDYRNTATSDLRVLFGELNKSSGANSPALNSPAPNSFVSAFDNQVQADLVATIVAQHPEGFLVSYRLNNPLVRINASGQDIKEQAQLVQKDLSQEIFATINAQGKILTLRFAPDVSKISQSFARTLLASIQFVTPQKAVGNNWETQEEDPNGQYVAQYQSQIGKIQKSKLRYLQSNPNHKLNNAKITPTITSAGQLLGQFDRDLGYLLSLAGKEIQNFEVSNKKVGQAETNLNLVYASQTQLTQTELTALQNESAMRERQSSAITLSQTMSEQESDAKIQRQQLGDSTINSLLAELDTAEKASDNADTTTLYLKFKALVYLHPETSAALAKRLINSEASSLSMQMLVGALSSIGHEQAQSALVQVMQDHTQDWQTQLLIIPSIATIARPTPETVNVLNQIAFNSSDFRVSSTAQLALGSLARNLAEQSLDRANAIVDRFIQNLTNAKSNEEVKQNLLVLGNAGSIRSLPAIIKLITSPQSDVRSTALVSLRWIQDPQVDPLLNQSLVNDIDETVRAEVSVALGFREMTAANFAIQKQVILSDSSAKVRSTLLKNLWQVREIFSEVPLIVQQLAQKDTAQEVREAATSLLAE